MRDDIFKTKTFKVCLLGIITAIYGLVTGDMSVPDALQTGLLSGLGLTLRDGIAKNGGL